MQRVEMPRSFADDLQADSRRLAQVTGGVMTCRFGDASLSCTSDVRRRSLAGAQIGDRGTGGDLIGVHPQFDHRRLAAVHRAAERRREAAGVADHFAMAAERLDVLAEVRICDLVPDTRQG